MKLLKSMKNVVTYRVLITDKKLAMTHLLGQPYFNYYAIKYTLT